MAIYENFLTYTEYDPNSNVTVNFNSIATASIRRDDKAYVRKDYGTPAQFGNFTHNFDLNVSSSQSDSLIDLWMLTANAANDTHDKAYTNADGLGFYFYHGASRMLVLRVFEGGGGTDSYNISLNTNYYITITRSGTTLNAYIYSDKARTVLLDTLTVTCTTKTYRYVYGMASRGVTPPANPAVSALMMDLDLGATSWTTQTACENAGCYWWAGSCHEGPRFPYDDLASGYLAQFQNVVPKGIFSTSGDYRTIEVNASGHVFVDVEIDVSSGLHVIQESGAFVQISGQHVYVESGVYFASGLAVVIESGLYLASGLAVTVESGLHTWISGQHVYVESGMYLASGCNVLIGSSGVVSISGNIVSISGNIVESTPPNTVRSPCVVMVRGGIGACSGTQMPSNAVESFKIRNLGVTNNAGCSGSLYISGEHVWLGNGTSGIPCSGCGMLLQSGEVMSFDIDNMNKFYVWAETSGNQVALIGTDIA